jgi:hypothetical protein
MVLPREICVPDLDRAAINGQCCTHSRLSAFSGYLRTLEYGRLLTESVPPVPTLSSSFNTSQIKYSFSASTPAVFQVKNVAIRVRASGNF